MAVKDGMGVTYPLQIEYGDFGQNFCQIPPNIFLWDIAGPADPETQERAGGGYENFNIKILVTMGEDESKFQFTDHGILLADGSACFIKGSIYFLFIIILFKTISKEYSRVEVLSR